MIRKGNSIPIPENGTENAPPYIEGGRSDSSVDLPEDLEAWAARQPLRLILDPEQSKDLAEHGEAFVVIGKGSYPDAAGRMTLHAVPTSIELANRAVRLARGTTTGKS